MENLVEEYKKTGDMNLFEDVIDKMMLENFDEKFKERIMGMSRSEKRMAILSLLDKDRSLFMKIKALTDTNISRMDHIKDVILMLRNYVKVGEVEKKKFGEVMTPLELVKEMLATLPEEVWSNPNLKWLDPANGTGPYPIMVIYKLMKGLEEWEPDAEKRYRHIVENMIYVCELQPKNMFLYMCAVDPFDTYRLNIYTGSFLEGGFDKHMKDVWGVEKFDLCIGNPPYQKGKDSNFYVKFIDKFFEISNKGAYLTFVVPNRFFQPSHKAHKSISNSDIKIVYQNVNKFFPDISTHIGLFLLRNTNSENQNKKIPCVFDEGMKLIDFNTPIPTDIKMSSYKYKSLLDKILKNEKIKFSKSSGNIYIKRQWKRWNSITGIGGDHVFNCILRENYQIERDGRDGRWVECEYPEKMEWYLSKSNLVRFLTKLFASAMNVPPFVWNIIPIIDLSKIHGNKDIYNFFELTPEDIGIIENSLK